MALWHDESHWNRYLLDHPPSKIVTPAYVFPETCLNPTSTVENCKKFREAKISPIMVAIDKDHQHYREA